MKGRLPRGGGSVSIRVLWSRKGNLGIGHDFGVVQKKSGRLGEVARLVSEGQAERLASGPFAPPPPLRSAPGCRPPPPQPQWLGQSLASCISLNLSSRNNAASCVSPPPPCLPSPALLPRSALSVLLRGSWWDKERLGDLSFPLLLPECGHRLGSSLVSLQYAKKKRRWYSPPGDTWERRVHS